MSAPPLPPTDALPLPGRSDDPRTLRLVDLLVASGWVSLGLFLINTVLGSLPLALFNPQWQLRFVSVAVANGGEALLGMLLLLLAAHLDPLDLPLQARARMIRHWALAAALGFLLLIPLQGWADWRLAAQERAVQRVQVRQAERQFSAMRQALRSAVSTEDLARRLAAINGSGLTEAQRRQPLPQLRRQLGQGLEQSRRQLLAYLSRPSDARPRATPQESLRRMITALALGLALASGAWLPFADQSPFLWLLDYRERRRQQRLERRDEQERRRQLAQQQQQELLEAERSRAVAAAEAGGDPAELEVEGLPFTFVFAELELDPVADPRPERPSLTLSAQEDPSLQLSLRPLEGGLELRFSRAVIPLAFQTGQVAVGAGPSRFRLRQGAQECVQGPLVWREGFGYPIDRPFRLEADTPLLLEGAVPEGLASGPLTLRELTVVEPPPSLAAALREEWQGWRRRWRGGAPGRPRGGDQSRK